MSNFNINIELEYYCRKCNISNHDVKNFAFKNLPSRLSKFNKKHFQIRQDYSIVYYCNSEKWWRITNGRLIVNDKPLNEFLIKVFSLTEGSIKYSKYINGIVCNL